MQETWSNCSQGISVPLRFTHFQSTRLSCTQHVFFKWIHLFLGFITLLVGECNAVPFERRFISQSLCKCDRSLSRESIRKARYFESLVFLFADGHRHIFCSSCSQGMSGKSCKEICFASAQNSCFIRILGAWHWQSAILSTAPRIYQHEDIWLIRAWYQNLVLWNGGIKGMSPCFAVLSSSPGHSWARFAPWFS